jgi:hypothetical protein
MNIALLDCVRATGCYLKRQLSNFLSGILVEEPNHGATNRSMKQPWSNISQLKPEATCRAPKPCMHIY